MKSVGKYIPPGKLLIDQFIGNAKGAGEAGKKLVELRNEAKEIDRSVTDVNFPSIFLHMCIKHGNVPLGEELMTKVTPTLSTLSLYTRLRGENGGGNVPELYEKIKELNKNTWDLETGDRVVPQLSKTNKWRDCFDIIKSMEVGGRPSVHSYASTVAACYANSELDLGWEQMEKLGYKYVPQYVFSSFIENCSQKIENAQKLLDFMDNYDFYVQRELMGQLMKFYLQFGVKAVETSVIRNRCSNCGQHLVHTFSQEEFDDLKKNFLEKVIVSKDIFENTNPKELEDFKRFVHNFGTVDFVLDGLNIGMASGKFKTPRQNLILIIKYIERQYRTRSILIIGRKHMERWGQVPNSFLIDNFSNDDPFILYAAMSNKDTKFVSRDLMRNHLYKLDNHNKILFRKWKTKNQITYENGKLVEFESLPGYFPNHFPVVENNVTSYVCLSQK